MMTLPKDDAPIDSVRSDGWPYNQSSWNPLTDWADHYVKIFDDDAWRASSEFDIIDVANGQICKWTCTARRCIADHT